MGVGNSREKREQRIIVSTVRRATHREKGMEFAWTRECIWVSHSRNYL